MYNKGYVATVRQGGQTLKETKGRIPIEFHTEYTIRLRNKTRKRAVADIYIDGRRATKGGIVVNANDHVDVERFIEDDLHSGRRFKFVPLESGQVKDKGEPDNGNIEVKFYPEKEPEKRIVDEHHHHHHHHDWHHHHHDCWPYWHPWIGPAYYDYSSKRSLGSNEPIGGGITYGSSTGGGGGSLAFFSPS